MKKMLLIFNPIAGKQEFVLNLYEVVNRFTECGFAVTVHPTQGRDNAFQVVLERAGDFDIVVCSGGDGTLNEVVCALMELRDKPLLGYIPSGSTNDYASSIGIPADILLAAETVCHGTAHEIDVGQFGERYFTYAAAFGLFTDVSYTTPQNLKNHLGHLAYLLQGVGKLANIRSYHCVVEWDGKKLEDDFVFGMITNSRSAGGFRIPDTIDIQNGDGVFELILLKKLHRFSELQNVVAALLNGETPGRSFVVKHARHFRIQSDESLGWTLDGEYGGSYHIAEMAVHQRALRLMTAREE